MAVHAYIIAHIGNYDSVCDWYQPATAPTHFGSRAMAAEFATRARAREHAERLSGIRYRIIRLGGANDPLDDAGV